jgi:hypothetical protein
MRSKLIGVFVSAGLVCSMAPQIPIFAKAPKVKYAKTEVDQAVGKCVLAVLLGGVAGAATGRVIGGKRKTDDGAIIGAVAGGAACAVMIKNAKRKDRIIAAQIATASWKSKSYTTSIPDDDGTIQTFTGTKGDIQNLDAAKLQPVKYKIEGASMASPVLETGGHECRAIDSNLSGSGRQTYLPTQYVCRTAAGDWQPYAMAKS